MVSGPRSCRDLDFAPQDRRTSIGHHSAAISAPCAEPTATSADRTPPPSCWRVWPELEYRGCDSAGIGARAAGGSVGALATAETAGALLELEKLPPRHHWRRHFENCAALRAECAAAGVPFASETDPEVVARLSGAFTIVGVHAGERLPGRQSPQQHAVALTRDQTLENATGVGAPPSTWPREEVVVDVPHKAVYSVATGLIAERLIRPALQSSRGRTSH